MDIGLKKAIEVVGTAAALAKKLNISRVAVYHWDVIPTSRVAQVAAITGLPIADLHPDFRSTEKPETG